MKLYDAPFPGTRASRVRWMLEELGAPYEIVTINPMKGEHKQPEYLALHPHGVVPAMVIDGQNLIESAAMCLQLADLYPAAGLAPPVGTTARAHYYQWMVYAPATLDDPLVARIFNTVFLPEPKRDPAKVANADRVWATAAPFLSRALDEGPWLLGDHFSAADVVIGYDVRLAGGMGMLAEHPTLGAYLERLAARPAFQRVFGG